MNKITTYIIALFTIGALASCTGDRLDGGAGKDADGKVTLKFGLVIPEAVSVETRSMLDEADKENTSGYLSNLVPYIFIFEDTGQIESNYLRTLVHGEQITPVSDVPDGDHTGYLRVFNATVDGTAEDAIIHVVLIHPDEKEFFEYQLTQITDRSELAMFSGATGLFTSKAAYWKRIPLGMPINSDNKETIQKVLLSHVQLVRNFAQVTVTKDMERVPDGLFRIDGFVIVNAMNCGYVAAYNEHTASNEENFVDFQDKDGTPRDYAYITNEVLYTPNRHPYAERDNKDNELGWESMLTDADWRKEKKYMFERPVQDSHRTFVLLRGRFNGATVPTYYKLELGDYDKRNYDATYTPYGVFEMYNIVRNMSYDITITDVASPGHETIASAVAGPPANNITASIETRNILRIGDGLDIIGINAFNGENDMLVDGTTVVIVDNKDGSGKAYPSSVNLRWQYWLGDESKYRNDLVKHDYPGYDLKTTATGGEIITSQSDWTGAGADWTGYTLNFADPTDTPKSETVRFYKEYGLSRDVTFILRKRWAFIRDVNDTDELLNVYVYPGLYSFDDKTMPRETLSELSEYLDGIDGVSGPGEVGSQRGAQLTVMFELPSDIPQSLFPLEFKIGFDRQNVENAYAGNATVVYGDSMFDDDGTLEGISRMQFIKTVKWEDYNGSGDRGDNGHKIVCARFLTTTEVMGNNETDADNGETSTTRVRVTNPYFTQGDGKFMRKVTDDENPDPDATRTVWSWYFGDPGWTKYFTPNEQGGLGGSHDDKGTYNELTYNSHYWDNHYGRYMGFGVNSSENNPDFVFEPNATSTIKGSATLTITGASWYYSTSGSITHWADYYYRRTACVRIDIIGADGTTLRTVRIDAYNPEVFFFQRRDGSNRGMPAEISQGIDLEEGETVTKITIWSRDHIGNNGKNEEDGSSDRKRTLYYSIRFTMPS